MNRASDDFTMPAKNLSPHALGMRIGTLLRRFEVVDAIPAVVHQHCAALEIEENLLAASHVATDADAFTKVLAAVDAIDQLDRLTPAAERVIAHARAALIDAARRLLAHDSVDLDELGRGHLAAEVVGAT